MLLSSQCYKVVCSSINPYGSNDVMRAPLLVSGFRAAFGGPLLNKIVLWLSVFICAWIYVCLCDSYFGVIMLLAFVVGTCNCICKFM